MRALSNNAIARHAEGVANTCRFLGKFQYQKIDVPILYLVERWRNSHVTGVYRKYPNDMDRNELSFLWSIQSNQHMWER